MAESSPRSWIWIGGALVGAAAIAGIGWVGPSLWAGETVVADAAPGDGAAIPVEVADVLRGDFDVERAFVGSLEPAASFEVSAKVSGRVEGVFVDLADAVERDALVLQIDDAELRQTVAAAKAELAVARAQLEAARATQRVNAKAYDRVASLHKKGAASAEEQDRADADRLEAEAEVTVAKARVQQRSAALEAAKVRASYAQVRATWAGTDERRVVGARHVDEGQTVAPNDPLLTIVDLDPLVAVVYATEDQYAALAAGQPVVVTTEGRPGETFEGEVSRVAPVFDQRSRQARVELEIPNAKGRLRPGMFVRATSTTAKLSDVSTVPRDAIIEGEEGAGPGVFLVDADGERARFVAVHLGDRVGERVVVRPADPGAPPIAGRVVTLGQSMLEDGARVRVAGAGGSMVSSDEAAQGEDEGSAS